MKSNKHEKSFANGANLKLEIGYSIRYLIATAVSFSLSLFLSFLFSEYFMMREELAVAFTLVIIFVINFFSIRLFVFKSRGSPKRQLIAFLISSIVFRGLDYLLFLIAFKSFNLNYLLALASALVTTFVLKYLYQRLLFKNQGTIRE